MPPSSVNWHTHTFRCHHATGDAADYCRAARAAGLEVLGFSDHMPTPDGRWSDCRMGAAELPGYVAAVRQAAADNPALTVFAGLECEWAPEFGRAWYEDELLGKSKLDYLVAGIHYAPVPGGGGRWASPFTYRTRNDAAFLASYVRLLLAAMDSGLFLFIAHPDLFGCFFDRWTPDDAAATRDIVQAAKATGTVLEINTNGLRKAPLTLADGTCHAPYPRDEFWRAAAEAGVPALVNSDAHHPEDIIGKAAEGHAFAARLGLQPLAPRAPADFR